MIEAADLLLGLEIAIAIMAIVALYHILFIVVDVRKIVRRVEDITQEVEQVILTPISMADKIFQWILETIEAKSAKSPSEHHHGKKEIKD